MTDPHNLIGLYVTAALPHKYKPGAWEYHMSNLARFTKPEAREVREIYSMLIVERAMPLRVA